MGCITDLEELMKKADHSFEYAESDQWRPGHAQREAIFAELRKIPMNLAKELVEKYIPPFYQPAYMRMLQGEKNEV